MPIYSYECNGAHEGGPVLFDAYVPLTTGMAECPECHTSEKLERIWSITNRTGSMIYPYTTYHITGQPLEIKSSRHLSQIEKQYRVRLRDDRDYVDEPTRREDSRAYREANAARRERGMQMFREIRAGGRG